MPRLYELEIQRNGTNAVMFYHDDGTLEIVDADTGQKIGYLTRKLEIAKLTFDWMKEFNVTSVECTKVI